MPQQHRMSITRSLNINKEQNPQNVVHCNGPELLLVVVVPWLVLGPDAPKRIVTFPRGLLKMKHFTIYLTIFQLKNTQNRNLQGIG